MSSLNKLAILFCVEKGFLEHQAILLVKSYLKFSKNENIQLFAFSPRKGHLPTQETHKFFKQNGVIHITEQLNLYYCDYPIANKIVSAAYFESQFKNYKSILFIDTDTVFLNPFQTNLIKDKNTLYLRPVGHKGPGTSGENDSNDVFWQQIYSLFGLPIPNVCIKTTIYDDHIRPYYNAGFIWSNGINDFYCKWYKDFKKLLNSNIRPNNYISRDKNNFRCLDQIALSVTASRYSENINTLSDKYNYHIPFRPVMKTSKTAYKDIIHMHYHKWFQHPGFLDHVTNDEEKKSEQYNWLKEHLPLLPEINGDFKC